MAAELLTADLLQHLCETLRHEDVLNVLVKTVVHEQKVRHVEELRDVPPETLEEWGLPLKLVTVLGDWFNDNDATSNVNGISAWYNYTFRPALAKSLPMLAGDVFLSNLHRHVDPEDWAARKLQGAWRCRKAREEVMKDKALILFDPDEIKRMSADDEDKVRLHRAKQTLRRFVHRWRLRRAERMQHFGLGDRGAPAAGPATKVGAAAAAAGDKAALSGPEREAVAKLAKKLGVREEERVAFKCLEVGRGKVRACKVKEFLEQVGEDLNRREDLALLTHRCVTLHWLEDVDDLDNVTEQHWARWAVDEEVSSYVRERLDDHTSGQVAAWADRSCNPFAFLWGGGGGGGHDDEEAEAYRQRGGFARVQDAESDEDAAMTGLQSRPPAGLMSQPLGGRPKAGASRGGDFM